MGLLKVGQVAKQIGISVRSLHYYEEISLLAPSERSDTGYRLYSSDDLIQLQKIKSLQQLGLTLQQVEALLKNPEADSTLFSIIDKHVHQLKKQIRQQRRLVDHLSLILGRLADNKKLSLEIMIQALKETIMIEKYFTDEQMEELAERREKLGEDSFAKANKEWTDLYRELRILMDKSLKPNSEEVQKIAKRGNDLVDAFTGGDPGIFKSLERMYEKEGSKFLNNYDMDIDEKLFNFMLEAMEVARA